MTRDEAHQECIRLGDEHPARQTHRWLPRQEANGSWSVVRIALPQADPARQAELRAEEKPPTPDDPRDAHMRNVGPWVGPA